ncbi:hypothetical protein [Sinomonas notoginsengisoli]|uniref:hypothetical protein n=1 Tax=Sinomonas notoginsengisoli TaxID=1457311 RepID=UPI001F21EE92|nr:hypothetical protein [Sinomonas notoginsengisoli]
MIAEFDSLAQWDTLERAASPSAAIAELTGMLRIALALSGRVLITESMLLDGWYFLRLGPHGVTAQLGLAPTALPLTVTGIGEDLRSSLARKRQDPHFIWQSLARPSGYASMHALGGKWEPWVAATESGTMDYERVGENVREFRLEDERIQPGLQHPASVDLLQRVSKVASRSSYVRIMAEERTALGSLDDPEENSARSEDLATLHEEWSRNYSQHIARWNRANWIKLSGDASAAGEQGNSESIVLRIPSNFADTMKECTAGAFALALSTLGTAQAALRDDPTTARLRGVAFSSLAVLTAPNRQSVKIAGYLRLTLALFAIVTAIPGFAVDFFGLSGPWLAFAAVALATMPWSDVKILCSLLKVEQHMDVVFFRGV